MAMFDAASQTVSLQAAAARVGISQTLAYDQAHKTDADGVRWLVPGHVAILRIGGRYRVTKRQLDQLLGPVDARADDAQPSVSFT